MSDRSGSVDIFRDTKLRYLGYSNEVGEAFRSIIGPKWVGLSYTVATSYVLADTFSKTKKMYSASKHNPDKLKKTVFTATDTLIWQMLASVVVPGYTINRTCAFANSYFNAKNIFPIGVRRWAVAGIGLAMIPIIIRPIDNLVDTFLDLTLRKFKP